MRGVLWYHMGRKTAIRRERATMLTGNEYISNQYAWHFFPEASGEKVRRKLTAMAATGP